MTYSKWWLLVGGIAIVLVSFLIAWTSWITLFVIEMDGTDRMQTADIESLLSGRTTPISAEARARFEGVAKELDHIRNQIDDLRDLRKPE